MAASVIKTRNCMPRTCTSRWTNRNSSRNHEREQTDYPLDLLRGFGFAGIFFLFGSTASFAAEDPSRVWIERPWEYRYVIKIESPSDYEGWKELTKKKWHRENDSISIIWPPSSRLPSALPPTRMATAEKTWQLAPSWFNSTKTAG